jgi:polysaccharide export outer membrane protein
MKKMDINKLSIFFISLFTLFSFTSCLTYKKIVSFQDGDDLKDGKIDTIMNYVPLKVQPGDVLAINVNSYNMEEAAKFNLIDARFAARTGGGGGVADPFGYKVNSEGYFEMPIIGRIYVKDLTIEEIRDLVYEKITAIGYLQDVSIQIQFLTFRITILGEVNSPGTYTITNSKITILEAVGLASDLTLFSKRDDIMIIREKDGNRIYGRVDLKTKAVFQSPYYYLLPNDIVYVNPDKSKILTTPDPVTRYIGTIAAVASFILLLMSL